ncbi:hypothetical protein SDC9_63229 [bioreactor metagenome]|uniref:Uncharacterized protein n=1 Tax=bioreactor metagenome TaxID=1076179 RepID=A0A644XLK2_9ZZZZ
MVKRMKEVYLYGAGNIGRDIYGKIKNTCNVKGYLDSDPAKWGKTLDGVPIVGGIDSIPELQYDEIIITITTERDAVRNVLLGAGAPVDKINTEYVNTYIGARLNFIQDLSEVYKNDAEGFAVAEGGVFQGDFAKAINSNFPDATLYLFDTFEGFDVQDTFKENERGYSDSKSGRFSNTSIELVMSKLPHPRKVVIRRGYFPKTTKGLEEERFFFVNLDFDLYQPTLEGLRLFYPRLSNRGVILVHDFFTQTFHGVARAIEDFEKEVGHCLIKLPIGDHCSIALVKTE